MTQNTNPFVLPGFGQSGDMASNPMLASMEMMRKAWESLAGASGFDASQVVPGASPEDLERRIADLRAVENWLRMNLSMLASTIQALEVQRSTLATLQAFVASAGGGATGDATPSPLDVALGIRRGDKVAPSADTTGLFGGQRPAASPQAAQSDAPGAAAPAAASTSGQPGASESQAPSGSAAASVEQGAGMADTMMKSWWDMLQTQFDNLASATSATLQGAEAMQEAATAAQQKATESTLAATDMLKKSAAAVTEPASKTPARKTAAKKTAAKKTTARKTAAKKAAKKTASRKTASAATPASASRSSVKKTADKKAAKKVAGKTSTSVASNS